jgi:hypothetical protein
MQVDKVLGCVEFWETDVSHHMIDLGPDPFTINPFLLDFLLRFLGRIHPLTSLYGRCSCPLVPECRSLRHLIPFEPR